jgi:ribosomal protein S6
LKTYQAMFIFSSSLTDDTVREILQSVRVEVEKLGGTVTATDPMGKRVFARPLKKMETGQYAKLLLQLPPTAVAPLLARLRLNEKIFRMQVVELKAPAKSAPAKPSAVAATAETGGPADGQPK